jgi:amino acid transporter
MSSSGIDIPGSAMAEAVVIDSEKGNHRSEKLFSDTKDNTYSPTDDDSISIKAQHDSTHRQLRPRHIQLIGIGGTIGTALYVTIGKGLVNGGPASLLLAFTIWYALSKVSLLPHHSQVHHDLRDRLCKNSEGRREYICLKKRLIL